MHLLPRVLPYLAFSIPMQSFQPHLPLQANSYGKTSIELAKQQTYRSLSSIGNKRPWSQVDHGGPAEARAVLSDRSNFQSSALIPPNRLKASEIKTNLDVSAVPIVTEYTQRRIAASTPGPEQDPRLSLTHPDYGLPDALIANFASLGIRAIYPWQSRCLLGHGLMTGEKNFVYTAPTGGGKSLVADVIMLKRVIEQPGAKALLVLPYVALVQEKLKWLRAVVEGVTKRINPAELSAPYLPYKYRDPAIRVGAFLGGSKSRVTWTDVDIAVCTIEKVGQQLACVVLDVADYVGEWLGQCCNRRRQGW